MVKTLLTLHLRLRAPMSKSSVLSICRVIELLKCVQYTFHRKATTVADYLLLIINHYELALLSNLETVSVSIFCQNFILENFELVYYVYMIFLYSSTALFALYVGFSMYLFFPAHILSLSLSLFSLSLSLSFSFFLPPFCHSSLSVRFI